VAFNYKYLQKKTILNEFYIYILIYNSQIWCTL